MRPALFAFALGRLTTHVAEVAAPHDVEFHKRCCKDGCAGHVARRTGAFGQRGEAGENTTVAIITSTTTSSIATATLAVLRAVRKKLLTV